MRARGFSIPIAVALWGLSLAGCGSRPGDQLIPPQTTVAPYSTLRGEVLWAVAPLANESGTTRVDEGLSDQLVAAAEEVRGVHCLPLNRTLAAMSALKIGQVRTPEEARALAQALGADAILVGSVTAYDPYTPKIGLTVALYARPGAMSERGTQVNPREVASSAVEAPAVAARWPGGPLQVVSEHFDGKNNQVLMDVKAYATGRQNKASALGWRRYVASAPLFGEFVAHRTVAEIVEREWVRLGVVSPGVQAGVPETK